MRKILTILATGLMSLTPVTTLISCNKGNNWNNISVDPPVLPMEVTGFDGIDFKSINPQDSKQTIPSLLKDLKNLFQGTKWNFDQLTKLCKFNSQEKPIDQFDVNRNGKYELTFSDTSNNVLKINKTVITSNNLADKVKSTNLGDIDDIRSKTILIATVFNNMGLISELDKFGEFFIGEQTPGNWNKPIPSVEKIVVDVSNKFATLESKNDKWVDEAEVDDPNKANDPATDYYGSVRINFTVKAKTPPQTPDDLTQMNLKTTLSNLPKITMLQIMMMFISNNFVSRLDKLSELLNDLYLVIAQDNKTATLSAAPGSKYFANQITLTISSN